MNVTFLSDSPLNTTVIDLVGGVHLYNITTKYEYGSPKIRTTTTIRGPHDEVVAVWERAHHRDQDRITYRGKMHTLEDWLPRKSALSRTRMLVAPDGERYHWKLTTGWGSNTLKLIAPESSRTIAQMRSARTGSGLLGSGKDRRLSLLVQPEATSMLDVIVLSFIILDQVRREQGLVGSTDTSLAVCPSVAAGATIVC